MPKSTTPIYIIGIETSCDDTSIAILKGNEDPNSPPEVMAHLSASQDEILNYWGGVVPEIAARNHLAKLGPLIQQTFDRAQITPQEIEAIGVTTMPGLLGPLLTGINGAKTLSLLFKKPIVPVNHLHAHLEAIHLSEKISYPYLGVLVSGGHGQFILVSSSTQFEVIGGTIDDAPGEAFDKGGKLLGLGYPAGRVIDQKAQTGDADKFSFPIGLKNSKDAIMSFSGVKTSLRQFIEKNPQSVEDNINDICASYQMAIVSAIVKKCSFAYIIAQERSGQVDLPIVVGGGVACNSYLRSCLLQEFNNLYLCDPKYCTDNGAMIANLAYRNRQLKINHPESLLVDAKAKVY